MILERDLVRPMDATRPAIVHARFFRDCPRDRDELIIRVEFELVRI